MNDTQQKAAAKRFAQSWAGKGYEKGESQPFWLSLLRDVYGVEHPEEFIRFEEQVHIDKSTGFIDAMIPATRVMIEQKKLGKDLNKPIKQSDGSLLNPFTQAKRYITELPWSQHPRWVVTCNFEEFYVYDMNRPGGEPEKIKLADLEKEYYRLQFLVDTGSEHLKREMEVSIAAGDIVGLLYDAFLKQYKRPDDPETLKSLNILCVRLVFCLYAEDAGIFGRHGMFHDYLAQFDTRQMRLALVNLFRILDQKPEERNPYLEQDDPTLAAFPYVNGGLFENEAVEIPPFTDEIRELLLTKASADFDWSEISPTIFGAVFESTLNPETRRSGGMHYTSIENIHKVIDPLFLTDLKNEFEECKAKTIAGGARTKALQQFHKKLGTLTFLDPACGSGNFLTETYLSIRRIENDCVMIITGDQIAIGEIYNPIQVSINQFYGIEINDFAVSVAKTALWIAESQMMKETAEIIHQELDFLPLKTNANIVEGNALRLDWESVVPKVKLNYIMGNPPFVGVNYLTNTQREDMNSIWKGVKRGKLDYVTCWYVKAAKMMQNTQIRTALVSTNSIAQGEQVSVLWKKLFNDGNHIDFAHRSFIWDSEASIKAHVHCVIVGFSTSETKRTKYLFTGEQGRIASEINGYLIDAPVVIIEEQSKPLCNVPAIMRGSQATDNGLFLFTPEEKESFLSKEPQAKPFFRRFMMGREFINNIERWCLWIPELSPNELKKCPEVLKRVQDVKTFRLASKNKQTQLSADIPWRFGQYRPPAKNYIAFAKVSSERRRYIPFGFLTDEVIPGDKLFTIPNGTIYMFGILTSNVHMAWMRTVCGRLEMRYSYSTTIVYNNFPWPTPTDAQRAQIEKTAQEILDARAKYPDSSLADLYDDLTMPPELRRAHQRNDKAVMTAYGFHKKGPDGKAHWLTESECVAELMRMYQELTTGKPKEKVL